MPRSTPKLSPSPAQRNSSLSPLGAELSLVINRVRNAFGALPMGKAAGRAEIRRAEDHLNEVVGQVQRGESDRAAWERALGEYERRWMALLDELRRAAGRACPAQDLGTTAIWVPRCRSNSTRQPS